MSWEELKANSDYQIFSEFPHQIRKKTSGRIVKEHVNSVSGYQCLNLRKEGKWKYWRKHRLIMNQFMGFDLDDPKIEIDHADGNKLNNHLENLRLVSRSENNFNRNGYKGIEYEFVEDIPDEAIKVKKYGGWEFEDLFFHEDVFYWYTGARYRKKHITEVKSGYLTIRAWDKEGKRRTIYYSRFKRLYDLI